MPTKEEIKDALTKPVEGHAMDYDHGWNAGVLHVANGDDVRQEANPDAYDDPPWYVGGFYHDLHDEDYYGNNAEWYQAFNDGKEAGLDMKNGIATANGKEKSPEEALYDRRVKCFTMAEKYAPQPAIRGGEREPVGETIKRAEALYDYFHGGTIPGAPVKEEK